MSYPYFSYSAGDTDLDRVRRRINDTVIDEGPLPGDANFTDEEINQILEDEGSWQRAVAGCLEALEAAWIRYPSFQGDGIALSRSHIAKNYGDAAREMRKRYGYSRGSTISAKSVIRIDGYNVDEIASDEVDN